MPISVIPAEPVRAWIVHPPDDVELVKILSTAEFSPTSTPWMPGPALFVSLDASEAEVIVAHVSDEAAIQRCFEIAVLRPDIPVVVVIETRSDHGDWVRRGIEAVVQTDVARGGRLPSVIQHAIARRARQLAREKGATFRAIVEMMTAGIAIIRDHRIVYANPAMVTLTGYSAAELIGLDTITLMAPVSQGVAGDVRRRRDLGESVNERNEWCIRTKAGAVRWMDVTTSVMTFDGAPALAAVSVDITERRQLEELARQRHHLDAIARLAGGIAHDFNNQLLVITADVERLLEDLPAASAQHRSAKRISTCVEEVAALTRDLLAFARRELMTLQAVPAADLVADLTATLAGRAGPSIEVRLDADPSLPAVRIDPVRLRRALLRLGAHAFATMPAGGRLAIRAGMLNVDEEFQRQRPWVSEGRWLRITMADTGTGIPAAALPNIFEPYSTMDKSMPSAGLGLSTAYGTVKQMGGFIWAENQPGGGASFTILLPPLQAPAAAIPITPLAESHGGARILMVEDEVNVREVLVESLRRAGFDVRVAESAEAALVVAAEWPFDLLLTDIVLPAMTGVELANRLRQSVPNLRALFMSGYTGDVVMSEVDQQALLEKPFGAAELLRRVRSRLAES